ncbi:carbohydrate ABC transporter permease [Konateibacter massiliensis]|uniref:carbohydrate ABC transporter permease n=1 Tax=Konateibacter massiliensis TaxID=2002841 RepID=UPI000C14DF8E|nr:sugar ABC transporter permease [Konateibacter massiliensis]
MKKFRSNKLAIACFTLPALIIFVTFVFIPIIQVFIYSFTKWNGISGAVFTGLANYMRLFTDNLFYTSNKNMIIFAVIVTVYQMILATIFALAVSNTKIKARKFFRVAYFIPVVLSVTVVCQLWLSIFNTESGLFNQILKSMGIDFRQNWLSDRYKSIYVIAFVNAWQWMGYQFALICAGIKSISTDYYEAAQIDGATTVVAHRKITIPLLAETYKSCLVIAITGGIKAFTEMFIMTKGGPGTSTYTLAYMMYSAAFRSKEYGYGLASASILVLECLMAIVVINALFKKSEADVVKTRKFRIRKEKTA